MTIDKVVFVEWMDSYHDAGWTSRDRAEAGNICASTCQSVGYLLKLTKHEIVIFQSKSSSGNIADILSIPKESITNIRYMRKKA